MFELQHDPVLGQRNGYIGYRLGMFELQLTEFIVAMRIGLYASYRLGMFELQLEMIIALGFEFERIGVNVIAWACLSCNSEFTKPVADNPVVIAWACLSCNPIPQVKLRKASVLRVCSRPPIVQNCWGVDGKSCNKNMSK